MRHSGRPILAFSLRGGALAGLSILVLRAAFAASPVLVVLPDGNNPQRIHLVRPAMAPLSAMAAQDEDDLIAFLNTLTDGYEGR